MIYPDDFKKKVIDYTMEVGALSSDNGEIPQQTKNFIETTLIKFLNEGNEIIGDALKTASEDHLSSASVINAFNNYKNPVKHLYKLSQTISKAKKLYEEWEILKANYDMAHNDVANNTRKKK